ncbi:hypothetical protein N792_12970 [Lysobacter concretionis Ko07 = DSM 16239]|jgi:hypothetical protein|uniref:Uncharacterized protein n=1 Tax=Lysobacter concretionis Ko07 = DSM 16239 TaxID=1122185 RepID=A0A0A0EL07_9GAMM|nr:MULTISPECIES: hypothetical protein [Lysobacter]KGM50980.1 hypothetical protein N792_12970 [Lysobacter concretionis Ko07 = DSM 16239]QOD90403.1 hypothetical protein H2514_09265 [Lysobacter sp. CW239]
MPMLELDADGLLRRVAERIPAELRPNIVVIGSIATAWAFRDVAHTAMVATKDIDLLLRPSVSAVTTAEALGKQLLAEGWQPRFPDGMAPGTPSTPTDDLPALRVAPPGGEGGWFVELLCEPSQDQIARKQWHRFTTPQGDFGLPSFRYMPVAIHAAPESPQGLRIALPANMALAHLLEHAEPDRTPIASLPGNPPRFVKDVGRAVALWWLAGQQSPMASRDWSAQWNDALQALFPRAVAQQKAQARAGLSALTGYLREAHAIAVNSVLAPHGTTLQAFERAHRSLMALADAS